MWNGTPNVDHADERAAVASARAGDRAAFASLVDMYWERIRRWLWGLTGCHATAEDLTQEVFLKAWSALPRLDADAAFRAWLFRIAQNCFLDSRRSRKLSRAGALPPDLAARGPSPFAAAAEEEDQRLVRRALDGLPSHYRAAYLLWVQEEVPYADIAKILAISEENARWRVCKARQVLLKKLEFHLDVPRK
jgi:RNA polymerase sigma-70 factor (ECF subfamily)